MLLRVRGHRHVDLVEQAQAPVDEVHVPVGDRVERARINADPHAEASVRSRWYRDRQVSPYRQVFTRAKCPIRSSRLVLWTSSAITSPWGWMISSVPTDG